MSGGRNGFGKQVPEQFVLLDDPLPERLAGGGSYGDSQMKKITVLAHTLLVFTFLLAACSKKTGGPTPAAEEPQQRSYEVIDCPDHADMSQFSADEVAGKTYECGIVTVPENYDNPDGRKIELLYVRLFSTSENPDLAPLLYLSGGPGGAATHDLGVQLLRDNLQRVRESRDIVFYDQRGTGYSAPINCGPVYAGLGVALELLPQDLVKQITALENKIPLYYNYIICVQSYVAAGIDLRQYNSVSSAHDMASLMTALGYDQYSPYGTSYGTKLAQVALRETPDRIPSAILDGTSPVSEPQFYNGLIEFNEQYVHIIEQCAADPQCNAAYPNLADRFTALLNKLQAEPIPIQDPIVPSSTIRKVMAGSSLAGKETINEINVPLFELIVRVNNAIRNNAEGEPKSILSRTPRAILAAEEGDVEYFRQLLGGGEAAPENGEEVTIIPDDQVLPKPWNALEAPAIKTVLAEAQAASAVTADSEPQEKWVALVMNDLATRIESEDHVEVLRDLINLGILPAQGTGASVLRDYANENLSGDVVESLNSLADSMTKEQIRETMWHINDIADSMSFTPLSWGLRDETTYIVNCAEDVMLRQDPKIVEDVWSNAPYPQLAQAGPDDVYSLYSFTCGFFPQTIVDPSFIEPVESDIPVLMLQGQMDTQTPPSGALEVASHLPNSIYVLFNSEGHVVAGKTVPCPGEIAAQFLNDPKGDLDTSCAKAFTINFNLP